MLEGRTQGALREKVTPPLLGATRRDDAAWHVAFTFVVLLAVPGFAGCSATHALLQCRRAEQVLRHAEQGSVSSQALYERTLARAYLEKAREEASEAQYGVSRRLAKHAEAAATRALAMDARSARELP